MLPVIGNLPSGPYRNPQSIVSAGAKSQKTSSARNRARIAHLAGKGFLSARFGPAADATCRSHSLDESRLKT
jgi:hypothetical protein